MWKTFEENPKKPCISEEKNDISTLKSLFSCGKVGGNVEKSTAKTEKKPQFSTGNLPTDRKKDGRCRQMSPLFPTETKVFHRGKAVENFEQKQRRSDKKGML